MTKLKPKIDSPRNGHIGFLRICIEYQKGLIHVQASFNNTIATVIDVEVLVLIQ